MANRAYLLSLNDKNVTRSKDPEREVIAEGINEIPLFWASLFVSEDRVIDQYDAREGRTEVANWCVESRIAKQRIKALGTSVSKLLDEASQQLWSWWMELIRRESSRFFKTNAVEVFALDPEGYEDYWATLLKAFSSPSARTVKAAMRRNDLTFSRGRVGWGDMEATICKLAGADHIRKLPWFERELPPPSDLDEPRTVYDKIYEAMSPDDTLEEAMRKAKQMCKNLTAKKRKKRKR